MIEEEGEHLDPKPHFRDETQAQRGRVNYVSLVQHPIREGGNRLECRAAGENKQAW